MKRIKIITGDGLSALQKNINKWIDEENPDIKSVSSVTHNPASFSGAYMVSILYSEEINLGGE